jgi:hypothetical protein
MGKGFQGTARILGRHRRSPNYTLASTSSFGTDKRKG